MSRKRYALVSLEIKGESAESSFTIAPRWMLITLGLAAIFVGAWAIDVARGMDGVQATCVFIIGAFFVVVGVPHLLVRSSFVLDLECRRWYERLTFAGFGRKREGNFDDAIGIQVVSWEVHGGVVFAVAWRWKDEQRAAKMLDWARHQDRARQKWVALGRELDMPLVEWRPSGLTIVEAETQ